MIKILLTYSALFIYQVFIGNEPNISPSDTLTFTTQLKVKEYHGIKIQYLSKILVKQLNLKIHYPSNILVKQLK